MRPTFAALAIAAVFSFVPFPSQAVAQDTASEVRELRAEVESLRLRLAQLELALSQHGIKVGGGTATAAGGAGGAGGTGGTGGGAAAVTASMNWARAESLKEVALEVTPEQTQALAALRAEVDQLNTQLITAKGAVGDAAAHTDLSGTRNTGNNNADEVDAQRRVREMQAEVRAEKVETLAIRKQLDRKRAELRQMEARMQPMKVITAQRGAVTYVLEVPQSVGNLHVTPEVRGVSWTGELLEAGGGRQRWLVNKVTTLTEDELTRLESQTAE